MIHLDCYRDLEQGSIDVKDYLVEEFYRKYDISFTSEYAPSLNPKMKLQFKINFNSLLNAMKRICKAIHVHFEDFLLNNLPFEDQNVQNGKLIDDSYLKKYLEKIRQS